MDDPHVFMLHAAHYFQGQDALCKAISCGFRGTVELLLSHGADPNSRDTDVSDFCLATMCTGAIA